MRVDRKPWRKMKTTITTRTRASKSVLTISVMPSLTASVVSSADHVVEIVGKPRLGLVHELGRGLHGVDGVGARELVDGDDGAGAAVEPPLIGVVLRAELDPRDVPHPDDRAVGGGPDHHVLEVRHALQASLGAHRVGELLARRHRSPHPPDRPG